MATAQTTVERVQSLQDKQKINLWLDSINETDQATREEVLEHCRIDKEARAFYVQKYDEDCK